jgi:putative transposase
MEQCAHARFVWNLAVEQHSYWQPGRRSAPGYLEQCRQLDAGSRESQARFACTACGFACNADVNAAKNIAAGHAVAVTARGGFRDTGPMNREPQVLASLTRRE